VNPSEQLLRRLAANDDCCLQEVLASERSDPPALDRETRALVQLSALLAADAATSSLRWAVDVAAAAGADDAAMVQVLLSTASATGAMQIVTGAYRLALALGVDIEARDGAKVTDPTARAGPPPSPARWLRSGRRRQASGRRRAPAS
jgi:alkylhydroperoxidase/carboxymuconolactone decarboxylase family protein YurZ